MMVKDGLCKRSQFRFFLIFLLFIKDESESKNDSVNVLKNMTKFVLRFVKDESVSQNDR